MKNPSAGKWVLFPAVLGCLLTGCLSRPALERQNFALQTPAVASPAASPVGGVLVLRSCEVSPFFANRALVYHTGVNTYENDPYAGFLVAPNRVVAVPVCAYLADSGLFTSVLPADDLGMADQFLQIYVDDLCGDFQNPAQPAAVLSLRMTLIGLEKGRPEKVLLQKAYSRHLPIRQNTAAALVAGWNQALGEILEAVASDLKAMPKPAGNGPAL
jgi:cholesterol transport system auxiliary component